MASHTTHHLVAIISEPRLKKYLDEAKKCYSSPDEQMDHALRLYAWNTALCAAFYGPIQALEIALRNAINQQLINKFGTEWYEQDSGIQFQDSGIQFDEKALGQIEKVKEHLNRRKIKITADNIVAQLSLGFWVKLFESEYETLWRKALHKMFQNNRPKQKDLKGRLIVFRDFRNRIAHHEPIFDRQPENKLELILGILGRINTEKKHGLKNMSA